MKRSCTYYQELKAERDAFDKRDALVQQDILSTTRNIPTSSPPSLTISAAANNNCESIEVMIPSGESATDDEDENDFDYCIDSGDEFAADNNHVSDDDDSNDDIESDDLSADANEIYQENLRNWALQYRINHLAINNLLQIINTHAGKRLLPHDARTLPQTPRKVIPVQALSGGGEYWHNGLRECLSNAFRNLNKPISISLNINIDGLPVFNSSKIAFWPILFNIAEIPKMPPMVIGIYCGASKITDVGSYFSPIVDELETIMVNGLNINSHKITVKLRCFVCDSPARAFVKGQLFNHNSDIKSQTYSSAPFHYVYRCRQFQFKAWLLEMYYNWVSFGFHSDYSFS